MTTPANVVRFDVDAAVVSYSSISPSPGPDGVTDDRQSLRAAARWGGTGTRLNNGSVLVVGGVQTNSPYTYASKAERFVVGP